MCPLYLVARSPQYPYTLVCSQRLGSYQSRLCTRPSTAAKPFHRGLWECRRSRTRPTSEQSLQLGASNLLFRPYNFGSLATFTVIRRPMESRWLPLTSGSIFGISYAAKVHMLRRRCRRRGAANTWVCLVALARIQRLRRLSSLHTRTNGRAWCARAGNLSEIKAESGAGRDGEVGPAHTQRLSALITAALTLRQLSNHHSNAQRVVRDTLYRCGVVPPPCALWEPDGVAAGGGPSLALVRSSVELLHCCGQGCGSHPINVCLTSKSRHPKKA